MLQMKKNFRELLETIISSSGLNLNKIWGYHFLNFEKLPDSYRQWLLSFQPHYYTLYYNSKFNTKKFSLVSLQQGRCKIQKIRKNQPLEELSKFRAKFIFQILNVNWICPSRSFFLHFKRIKLRNLKILPYSKRVTYT